MRVGGPRTRSRRSALVGDGRRPVARRRRHLPGELAAGDRPAGRDEDQTEDREYAHGRSPSHACAPDTTCRGRGVGTAHPSQVSGIQGMSGAMTLPRLPPDTRAVHRVRLRGPGARAGRPALDLLHRVARDDPAGLRAAHAPGESARGRAARRPPRRGRASGRDARVEAALGLFTRRDARAGVARRCSVVILT